MARIHGAPPSRSALQINLPSGLVSHLLAASRPGPPPEHGAHTTCHPVPEHRGLAADDPLDVSAAHLACRRQGRPTVVHRGQRPLATHARARAPRTPRAHRYAGHPRVSFGSKSLGVRPAGTLGADFVNVGPAHMRRCRLEALRRPRVCRGLAGALAVCGRSKPQAQTARNSVRIEVAWRSWHRKWKSVKQRARKYGQECTGCLATGVRTVEMKYGTQGPPLVEGLGDVIWEASPR